MKRRFCVFVSCLLLFVFFAGCGRKDDPEATAEGQAYSDSVEAEEPSSVMPDEPPVSDPVGETWELSNGDVILVNCENGYLLEPAGDGLCLLSDPDGKSATIDLITMDECDSLLSDGSLALRSVSMDGAVFHIFDEKSVVMPVAGSSSAIRAVPSGTVTVDDAASLILTLYVTVVESPSPSEPAALSEAEPSAGDAAAALSFDPASVHPDGWELQDGSGFPRVFAHGGLKLSVSVSDSDHSGFSVPDVVESYETDHNGITYGVFIVKDPESGRFVSHIVNDQIGFYLAAEAYGNGDGVMLPVSDDEVGSILKSFAP